MPNVPPPPISARMTATGGKHRPEKPLRKLRQLAKSSREDQPCRSLRKLPVNQSHESPSPLHKSIRKFVHAPLYASTDIPADWDQANRFRMRTTKAIYDHDMQPRTRLVAELERRLEQAERAESERPSPEQVKALALRMAEQRAQAENPTQDTKRPAPSGDEPLDLSEPEDWGEASPFESRQAPRTKADLLNEIRQRTDRLTGQREAEQRQIDPWSARPPQRRGHGR